MLAEGACPGEIGEGTPPAIISRLRTTRETSWGKKCRGKNPKR